MLSPSTARGLLGPFPRSAYPPSTDQRATTRPILFPTSLSLRAILAARFKGRGAWGGASGRRSLMDGGGDAPEQGGGIGTKKGGRTTNRGWRRG